jgi:hypothetical protein
MAKKTIVTNFKIMIKNILDYDLDFHILILLFSFQQPKPLTKKNNSSNQKD